MRLRRILLVLGTGRDHSGPIQPDEPAADAEQAPVTCIAGQCAARRS